MKGSKRRTHGGLRWEGGVQSESEHCRGRGQMRGWERHWGLGDRHLEIQAEASIQSNFQRRCKGGLQEGAMQGRTSWSPGLIWPHQYAMRQATCTQSRAPKGTDKRCERECVRKRFILSPCTHEVHDGSRRIQCNAPPDRVAHLPRAWLARWAWLA